MDSSHPQSCLNHSTKATHLQPSKAGVPERAGKESVKLRNYLLLRPRPVLLLARLFLISTFSCNYKYCRKTHPSAACLSKSLMLVCAFNDDHYISPFSVQLYQEIKYSSLSPGVDDSWKHNGGVLCNLDFFLKFFFFDIHSEIFFLFHF